MTDVIGTALIRILPDMSKFGPGMASARGPLGGLSNSFKALGGSITEAGKSMSKFSLLVGAVGFAGYKAAEQFQTSMLEVKAVTDDASKSAAENAAQYAALEAEARKLGRTGLFSASQAAIGLSELTRAGFTATQAIHSLGTIANFATAAHMDLQVSAKAVVTQLKVYGMAAEEVGRITDAMAESDFRSISSMEEITNALAYASPVAEKAGTSFEALTASLASMANAGFRGSMGGTALRAIYAHLLHPTKQAQEIIKKLGITIYDAHGEMLPMVEILKEFENSGLKAGDAMALFGQRGGPGFLGFLKQGSAALAKLTKQNQLSGHEVETMGKKFGIASNNTSSLRAAFLRTYEVLSKLHVNMDESTGVLATYIKRGMGAKEASESLTKALKATRTEGFAKLVEGSIDANGNLVNAQGESIGLAEALGILQSKGLTTADSLKQFGGSAEDLARLARTNVGELVDWTEANLNAGRSADVARIQMEGMKGSVKRLRGSLESLAISMFGGENGVLGTLAGFADKIAKVIAKMSEANPEVMKFITLFLILTAAIGPVLMAVGFMVSGLGSLLGIVSSLLSPLGLLVGAIGAIAGAFYFMWTNSERLRTSVGFLFEVIGALLTPSEKAEGASKNLSKALGDLSEWGREAGDSFAHLVDQVTASLPGIVQELTPHIQDLVQGFQDLIPAISEFLRGFAAGVIVALKIAIPLFKAAAVIVIGLAKAVEQVAKWIGSVTPLVRGLGMLLGVFLTAKVLGLGSAFTFLRQGTFKTLNELNSYVTSFGYRLESFGRRNGGVFEEFGKKMKDFGKTIPSDLGDKVFSGFALAAASAMAGVSGYMAGMAKSTTDAAMSMVGAATSVAMAFSVAGPIGAAVAAATAAVGFLFGRAAAKARDAKNAQKEYAESIREMAAALDDAGVTKFSTSTAKTVTAVKILTDTMKASGEGGKRLNLAFDYMGVRLPVVAAAMSKGKAGMKDLNTEILRATTRKAEIISDKSLDGISKFGHLTGLAQTSLNTLGIELGKEHPMDQYKFKAAMEGVTNLKELRAGFKAQGIEVGTTTELQKRYEEILQTDLAASPAAQYIAKMPDKMRAAYAEQQRFAEAQRLITEEQMAARGEAVKFSEAYDSVKKSISDSTTAYDNWLSALEGGAPSLANIKLGIIDIAKQIRDTMKDPDISNWEKDLIKEKLVSQASHSASEAIGRFAQESGGNLDVFNGKVAGLRTELETGLVQSLGVSKDEAKLMVAEMLKIPSDVIVKMIADTDDAITDVDQVKTKISEYIAMDKTTLLGLNTGDAEANLATVRGFVDQWIASNPETAADLNIDKASGKKKLIDEIINNINGKHASASADIIVTTTYRSVGDMSSLTVDSVAKSNGRWLANAEKQSGIDIDHDGGVGTVNKKKYGIGGIFSKATDAIIGEAGTEVLLPLTNRKRTVDLVRKSGLLSLLSSENALPVSSEGAVSAAAEKGTLSPNLLKAQDASLSTIAGFGPEAWKAASPGLTDLSTSVTGVFTDMNTSIDDRFMGLQSSIVSWPGTVLKGVKGGLDGLSTGVTDSFSRTANTVTTGYTKLMSDLSSMSSTGGSGVVSSLKTALGTGTGVVGEIVHGYGVKLINAINPILAGIGSKKISLKGYAKGGINDPRIVKDGSYETHVFGESGTHGEAYIPFNPSLRGRSQAIAEKAVEKLGGVAYFARGGITGDTKGLNPEFRKRLEMWSSAVGSVYPITSGYRSLPEQAALFRKYMAGTGNLAAKPGRSMHNFGLAADGPAWGGRNPGAFGLTYPIPTEDWHVQPVGAKGMAGMMPDGGWSNMVPLPTAPSAGNKGVISALAGAMMGTAYSRALDWAGSAAGGSGTSATLSALPTNIQHILATIRTLESGNNYRAKNKSSSASGAYQFTRGTWGGYGGYANAMDAPASVQDAKAAAHVRDILNRYSNSLEAVPAAWYTGVYKGHGNLDYRPGGPGNPMTVQQYVDKWLGAYGSIPGFANGGDFSKATLGIMGEAGREVLLPMRDPARALELAVGSGMMNVLDAERSRTPSSGRPGTPTDGGFLGGGPGNVYYISGITLDQVRAEIAAHDKAVASGRR